jgi:hypothetical protein
VGEGSHDGDMERMQPLAKEQLNPILCRINTASKVVVFGRKTSKSSQKGEK